MLIEFCSKTQEHLCVNSSYRSENLQCYSLGPISTQNFITKYSINFTHEITYKQTNHKQ